ncbi:MAG: hypothetical protein SOV26_03720 [Candidatus Onthovivens sp.]|nr:hypothetical protein [Candidatus Onthovivens sp.]
MKYLPLIIYCVLAILIIFVLILLIPSRNQYFSTPTDNEEEDYLSQNIISNEFKVNLVKMKRENQILFWDLYNFILTFNGLDIKENKKDIHIYINGTLIFVIDISQRSVLFSSKINNITYPSRFKNKGNNNFIYINTQISLEDAKTVASLICSKLG